MKQKITDAYQLPCFYTGEPIVKVKKSHSSKGWTKITAIIVSIAITMSTVLIPAGSVHAKQILTKKQQQTADKIAEIADANWEKYGVLPSVAVGQAYKESSLGVRCPNYNLWGIGSGSVYYGSLKDGVIGYLRVINNGYYPNAPFERNYKKQLRRILDGGYCTPVGDYYEDVMYGYSQHNFEKYDKALFKRLSEEKKERKKEEKQVNQYIKKMTSPMEPFTLRNDPTLPEGIIYANADCIAGGAVMIFSSSDPKDFVGTYEVAQDQSISGNVIRGNLPEVSKEKVYLRVYENAVG